MIQVNTVCSHRLYNRISHIKPYTKATDFYLLLDTVPFKL